MDDFQMISGHRHGLYDVPEHEVLISFNNDEDAYFFMEWLEENRESLEDFVDKRGFLI